MTRLGPRILLGGVVVVVAAAVGYGTYLLGSPAERRSQRFDEQRVSDLESISRTINAYWESNRELPGSLEDLREPEYFVRSIEDQATGEPYEYRVLGESQFELCAVFATSSAPNQGKPARPFLGPAWEHGAGRSCFELEAESSSGAAPMKPPGIAVPAPIP